MVPCPVTCPGTRTSDMKVNVTLEPYERKKLAFVKQLNPRKKANLVYETDFTEFVMQDKPEQLHGALVASQAEATRLLRAEELQHDGERLLVKGQYKAVRAAPSSSPRVSYQDDHMLPFSGGVRPASFRTRMTTCCGSLPQAAALLRDSLALNRDDKVAQEEALANLKQSVSGPSRTTTILGRTQAPSRTRIRHSAC